jgi:hypothetical protein
LFIAGAMLPIWDIAVAPDDSNFVVVITDGAGIPSPPLPDVPPNGPKNVFISSDGGQNWQNANLFPPLPVGEFISCLAISPQYDIDKRYIAIGTRDGTGAGKILTLKAPGPSSWENQSIPLNGWKPGDIVALKFSPSYTIDYTIVVAFASSVGAPVGLFLNIGTHDVISNRTQWKIGPGYPVRIVTSDNKSPDNSQIITADLEIPADYSGADPGSLRRYFLSFDARESPAALSNYFSGVYRIDDMTVFQLFYNLCPVAFPSKRISSIAYYGTYAIGKLIAGETTTNLTRGKTDVWFCSDPFTITPPPTWKISDTIKSPTGGGNSGFANALLFWSADGVRIYCGTSSSNLINGGTSFSSFPIPGRWPNGLFTGYQRNDESAFSVSRDNGLTWNQLSLIDTEISKLVDVAIIQPPENALDYSALYLASINTNAIVPNAFDSVWRSIRDPLGQRWERIWCGLTVNNAPILRLNPRVSEPATSTLGITQARSRVIMVADRNSADIWYSADEGQNWQVLYPNYPVTDFSLASDTSLFILSDIYVLKGYYEATAWKWGNKISTGLTTGHTIATPLKNPKGKNTLEDWVMVGSTLIGEVSWADFSQASIKFNPSPEQIIRTPVQGDVHILADEQFDANKIIYAGVKGGKVYRWVIGKSLKWDELQPPDNDFYGVEQKKGTLYGAYDNPLGANIIRGVDRTLYPRSEVPPPPEWDFLTAGKTNEVMFTLEPSSLRASTNADNNLWAIDNRSFNWSADPKVGCLWMYTDTLAKNGPRTTAPASNDVLPIDPVTGRANEVNFSWRQLSYATGYEMQLAKDENFFLRVLDNDPIIPSNPIAPGWVLFPGQLEASHKYFWRVRASTSFTGERIRSPWSATMYFTVMAGFPVTAKYLGPTLLQPPNQCNSCGPSPSFSWSPMFLTTGYEFILARDSALTQVIEKAAVPSTTYQYQNKLEKGTYYWQVKAIKPMISEPSPVFTFNVNDSTSLFVTLFPEISEKDTTLIWIGILIYTVFIACVLGLIIKTRYFGKEE